MLTKEPRRRPNITDLLKMPVIEKRISQFLQDNAFKDEFSHTLLHNKDVFKEFQKRQEADKRLQEQQL
jgi:NIMA (never in mitosis gene a)-related kinase